MKEIISPLTQIAGVRMAALITPDGVPISLVHGQHDGSPSGERNVAETSENFAAYAGLAAGWLGQVARTTDPLTWNRPRRAVLRGTRGTLIMSRAENAILMVIIDQGTGAEELRLPMDSALARMQRHLKQGTSSRPTSSRTPLTAQPPVDPPSLLPRRDVAEGNSSYMVKNNFSEKAGGV